MSDIDDRLRIVEDRLAIIELEGTYARSFDDRDGDTWSSLFTPDGVYQARVRDENAKGTFVAGTENLRRFCSEAPFTGIHFLHLPQITLDGDRATSRIHLEFYGSFADEGASFSKTIGYYDVAYQRGDGRWLIERRVTTTFRERVGGRSATSPAAGWPGSGAQPWKESNEKDLGEGLNLKRERQMLLEMMRRMVLIRRFDERVADLHRAGEIVGAVHLYFGEEAVAVGGCLAMQADDYVSGNHRSHGHAIAKGCDVGRVMAELYGKATGVCKGKGGSMHLADFSVGQLGESGIVGSSIPVAVGAAFGSLRLGTGRVAATFFGDGALGQGILYESMNLAAIWKLPVIFICENNGYAVSSPARMMIAAAADKIANVAQPFGIPNVQVDGQDVLAVHDAMATAVTRARAGNGPSFIEAITYRYSEHAFALDWAMKTRYRSDEEIDRWKTRDPLELFRAELISHHAISADELDAIEAEVSAQLDDAVDFARRSPDPTPDELFTDMYSS